VALGVVSCALILYRHTTQTQERLTPSPTARLLCAVGDRRKTIRAVALAHLAGAEVRPTRCGSALVTYGPMGAVQFPQRIPVADFATHVVVCRKRKIRRLAWTMLACGKFGVRRWTDWKSNRIEPH